MHHRLEQCCGAGGAEIILRSRSQKRSRIQLFRPRLRSSRAEIIFLLKILCCHRNQKLNIFKTLTYEIKFTTNMQIAVSMKKNTVLISSFLTPSVFQNTFVSYIQVPVCTGNSQFLPVLLTATFLGGSDSGSPRSRSRLRRNWVGSGSRQKKAAPGGSYKVNY